MSVDERTVGKVYRILATPIAWLGMTVATGNRILGMANGYYMDSSNCS